MEIDLREVGAFAASEAIRTGDLFLQRYGEVTILTLRVEEDGRAFDLLLTLAGANPSIPQVPDICSPGSLGFGPYRVVDFPVIVRPRSFIQAVANVETAVLLVDERGAMVRVPYTHHERTFFMTVELATGRVREPSRGAFVYASWEIVFLDPANQVRVIAAFGS